MRTRAAQNRVGAAAGGDFVSARADDAGGDPGARGFAICRGRVRARIQVRARTSVCGAEWCVRQRRR